VTTGEPLDPETSDTIVRSGTRLARHSLLSFSGYAVPLLVAVVAIPVTARALGPVRFGLLGLAWALVEYLSFVDLSIGRTSVRFVAEGLALRSRELRQIVSVAVAVQGVAATTAAVAVALLAERLAFGVFTIPLEVREEAAAMFLAVAANLAVVILIAAIRGVLEGAQRFDASNALKIPSATAAILVPAIGAPLGLSLPAIMWLAFAVRVVVLVFAFATVPRVLPGFAWEVPREWRILRRMFGYSAWLAVSGLINPLLVTFDRLVLARIAGSAAVGFYTAPYEAATRLLAVAISTFLVLFPAITSEFARNEKWRTQRVLESTLRQILLVFAVPVVVLFAFAPEMLRLWLGPTFGLQGTTAFRILLLGVLANALAHVPFVYLYAAGRPDLPAKNHIFELFFHVPLTLLLIGRFGITGAAAAWTIRVVVDSLLLGWMAARRDAFAAGPQAAHLWRAAGTAILCLVAGAAGAVALLGLGAAPAVALVVLVVGAYVVLAWLRALSADERSAWLGLLSAARRGKRS
jgi:O-antigen/teichoic acid export membrane protein